MPAARAPSAPASVDGPHPLRTVLRVARLVLLLPVVGTASAADATFHVFDASTGEVLIHTGRGGLLGFAGHRHRIRARSFEGTLTWPADAAVPTSLSVRIDATSLTVEDDDLDEEDVAKVQADMETRVLETESFPAIGFAATAMEPDGDDVRVTGTLELHGVAREISFPLAVTRAEGKVALAGEIRVRQSDHGIRPVSAALGSVKVKDEVRVEIRIDAAPAAAPLDGGGDAPASSSP